MAIQDFDAQAAARGTNETPDNQAILVAQNANASSNATPPSTPPARTVIEIADGSILRLPEGASIDSPRVNGNNLEFVQADDSVDRTRTGDIRDRPHVFAGQRVVLDRLHIVQRGPHPRFVEQLLTRHERDVPAGILGLVEKLVALVFACDADDVALHRKVRNTCRITGVMILQSLYIE